MTPTKFPEEVIEKEMTKYIGIDVGKKRCYACVTNETGSVLDEFSFQNNLDGINELIKTIHPTSDNQCNAVLESTANMWIRAYHALEDRGIAVKLANPNKTKAIASATIKTDKLSAKILADLLRANLIAECFVSPKETREINALLRQRASLVKMQTMVKNRVHALLDRYDHKSNFSDMFGVQGMEWLKMLELNQIDRYILDSHVRHIECLKEETTILDSKIASIVTQNEDAKLLMTLTGIDYHSALLIASEICDIRRFPSPKHLVSWIGLCPSIHQSGNSLHIGGIKKDSNKRVRWVLVQAAQTASRTDPRMKSLHDRIALKKDEGRAVIRVANKMATIIWHILAKKQPYYQVKQELYQSKLKKISRIAA